MTMLTNFCQEHAPKKIRFFFFDSFKKVAKYVYKLCRYKNKIVSMNLQDLKPQSHNTQTSAGRRRSALE